MMIRADPLQASSEVSITSPRRFRIFVSSPGDLGDERAICARVVERLRGEFASVVLLQAILWEQEPLTAEASFQDQIPLPAETDLVIVMLWSRLGYRLHPKYKTAADAEVPTGTIFEFRNAFDACRAHPEHRPDILVYRKTSEPAKPSITDEAAWNRAREEWKKVEAFFHSAYFRDENEGAFTGAYHTFGTTADFEETLEEHLRKIIVRRLGEVSVHDDIAITWKHGSPFRGLEHFDFEHADIFFGRARAAAKVRDALRRQAAAGCAFVLVLGASGGGKSSLVRAGVLPDLVKPGVVEGIGLWRRVIFRPGETAPGGDLFDGLAEALCRHTTEGTGLPELLDQGEAPAHLAASLRVHPAGADALLGGGLRLLAERARAAERETLLAMRVRHESEGAGTETSTELDRHLDALPPVRVRLALVVDQLEEIFTDSRFDAPARAAFLATLATLARGGRVWIIVTLRSDFFNRCEAEPLLAELKAGGGTYHLLPPSETELAQMIRKPARAAGLRFEEEAASGEALDDLLQAAAARDPSALPLLEFCLEELYKEAAATKQPRLLTHAAYKAMSGVAGALARRAEEIFNRLRPWQQNAFDHVLRGLTTLPTDETSDAAPIRRHASYDELTRPPGAKDFVDAFLAPDARLFLADRHAASGQATVAVTHEALFTAWPRLRNWLDSDREFLRARARLSTSAALWRQENEDASYLFSVGKALVEAEDLMAQHQNDLSGDEKAFALASLAAARQRVERERRNARRVLLVVSTALVIAVGLGVASFWQYREARRQENTARAAQKQAQAAEAQKGNALAQKSKALEAGQAQIHQACVSDLATARNLFSKDNWREGLIYLRRAQTYNDPANLDTNSWLWSEIVYGRGDRDKIPDYVIPHPDEIWSVAYSPDGTRIVTACVDGAVRQWEAATGRAIGEPMRHGGRLRTAVYSPDGRRIVSASDDRTARQWDAGTGQPIGQPLQHEQEVEGAAYSPDGTYILTCSSELKKTHEGFLNTGEVQQWDAATGRVVGKPLRHEGGFLHAVYSPDGKRIAAAPGDLKEEIMQYDALTGKIIGGAIQLTGTPFSVSYSPDGLHLLTACNGMTDSDYIVQQWDAATGNAVGGPLHHDKDVGSAVYSPDGLRILTACNDGMVRQWDAITGKMIGESLSHDSAPNLANYNPDGTRIVTAAYDHTVEQWDASTDESIGEPLFGEAVHYAALSPDGKRMVAAKGARWSGEGKAQQFNTETGQRIGEPLYHDGRINSTMYSPDGKRIVTASDDHTARQWDAATSQPIGEPLHPRSEVKDAVYSPDGLHLVTACKDGTAQQWDAATGAAVGEPLRHAGPINSVAYSPDGKRIVTASDDHTARQWDAATSQPIGEPMQLDSKVESAAYSPDGIGIVISDASYAQEWNAATGKPTGRHLRHERLVSSAIYSPGNARILTAGSGYLGDKRGEIHQWNSNTGQPIGAFLRPIGEVSAAIYSPDGTYVLSVVAGGLVRRWDYDFPGSVPPWWMDDLVQALSGLRFNDDGELEYLGLRTRLELANRLRARFYDINQTSDGWRKLAVWALSPPGERRCAPNGTLGTRTVAEGGVNSDSAPIIEAALHLDPTLPLVHLAYAGAVKGEKGKVNADFLRQYDLQRLPHDARIMASAATMLCSQQQYTLALATAKKAVGIDPEMAGAHRQLARSLEMLDKDGDAMAAYEKLLEIPGAEPMDFIAAGQLAAKLRHGERARQIFQRAEKVFPNTLEILSAEGSELLGMDAPAEALVVLQRCESMARKPGVPPDDDVMADLAACRWLTGNQQGAVADYQRLIAHASSYAEANFVASLDKIDAKTNPLPAILAETLRQHPELTPKPSAAED